MPLFKHVTKSGHVIESEPKDFTLRLKDDSGQRLGSVEVQAAGLSLARITNLNMKEGTAVTKTFFNELEDYLRTVEGFTELLWEREVKDGVFALTHIVIDPSGKRSVTKSRHVVHFHERL